MTRLNEFNQPIGDPLPHWQPREMPSITVMEGAYCRLEKTTFDRHSDDIYNLICAPSVEKSSLTYFILPPSQTREEFDQWFKGACKASDPYQFAIVDKADGRVKGCVSLFRIDPKNGVIECAHVMYSPQLRGTRVGTEVHYLLGSYVFDNLGYRRYEWKCDALNEPSRNAATRYGFKFEAIFRQALVYKGRTRDTAWYSIIDSEWPDCKSRFEKWLDADNFDADGKQKKLLRDM
eukprot:Blabericola_migrator_1__1556@NODE_140_length_13109_cov_183_610106_g122_i0_p5_GENE_NODE_140_length_13109_cov_183_610106_g122_i0NODE_140_length_13109_cov_183_610106_g122_i0_p5_ORF_typecomplete_len234_score34_91Acetyltransf_3/PF13302_7/6_9e22Acetyltransf_4/PF13420_7/8_9e12Acetyltransf_1/PF00583_25/2_1e06Acetyltransf_8/PF13523_6/0_051GNAT_acetyltran/PF12746_7/0_065_NODE_140_length_13109_cov_183_610106_g122_i051405841